MIPFFRSPRMSGEMESSEFPKRLSSTTQKVVQKIKGGKNSEGKILTFGEDFHSFTSSIRRIDSLSHENENTYMDDNIGADIKEHARRVPLAQVDQNLKSEKNLKFPKKEVALDETSKNDYYFKLVKLKPSTKFLLKKIKK